jgi:uncharacterized protein YggU (UPF0235/DUF167 family)
VKPGASRNGVGGKYDGPHGPALIVAVQAPAVDGRATLAVVRELAAALGVHRRDVTLKTGAASRDKLFVIADPPSDLDGRLAELYSGGS